jgi:hypothetical protein
MHFASGSIVNSPSDLITFIESEYASWMDLLNLEETALALPDGTDDQGRIIMDAGVLHEKQVLETLAAEIRSPTSQTARRAEPTHCARW